MYRFWDSFIHPLFLKIEPRTIIEIGSFNGENTERLLNFCRDHNATLHAIDPLPQFNVSLWEEGYGRHFVMHTALSLDALGSIPHSDVVLIDGDHNWYTVYHELKLIEQVAKQVNLPLPVMLFHDIAWPYARRDLYYDPDNIPAEFRHQYQVNGIIPGESTLRRHGVNYNLPNAVIEGGPRNGVLTAVEDFVSDAEEPLSFLMFNGFSGLGILYPNSIESDSPELWDHLKFLESMRNSIDEFLLQLEEDRIARILGNMRLRRRKDRLERELASLQAGVVVPVELTGQQSETQD